MRLLERSARLDVSRIHQAIHNYEAGRGFTEKVDVLVLNKPDLSEQKDLRIVANAFAKAVPVVVWHKSESNADIQQIQKLGMTALNKDKLGTWQLAEGVADAIEQHGKPAPKKIYEDSAVLATALAGSIALGPALTAMSAKSDEDAAKSRIDGLKSIEVAARQENAPKTLAAIEQEQIAATSEIIRERTAEGWALGGTVVAGAAAVGAASRIGRNKKKPGAENQTGQNSGKTRG